jgi:hypothetical protein
VNSGTLLFVNFAVYSWLLFLPIIGMKAWELKKTLPVSTGRAASVAALANLASTLLATVAVLAIGSVLGYCDVIAQPQAGEGDAAVLVALVPCFFLSAWMDRLAGSTLLRQVPVEQVRSAFFRANQLGYAMIAIVPVARFVKSAVVNGRIIW